MIEKRLLVPDRVRRPPREGFSWVDRRFLREFAARLSADAVLLYFFLTAVSDKQGLSFYSDTAIAARLRMREQSVVNARDELISDDLIAYQPPRMNVDWGAQLALRTANEAAGGTTVCLNPGPRTGQRTMASAPMAGASIPAW